MPGNNTGQKCRVTIQGYNAGQQRRVIIQANDDRNKAMTALLVHGLLCAY